MHSVGFEPTSANTLELESSSLDRSDTNACESGTHLYKYKESIMLKTNI